jgi:hypothetical protein
MFSFTLNGLSSPLFNCGGLFAVFARDATIDFVYPARSVGVRYCVNSLLRHLFFTSLQNEKEARRSPCLFPQLDVSIALRLVDLSG